MRLHFFNSAVIANSKMDYSLLDIFALNSSKQAIEYIAVFKRAQ